MNRGVLAGLKRLFVPASLGGGDSANDGLALVLDSTQEGGVRPSQSKLASAVALVAKAITGQTADIQQWVDGSGTLLARIDSAGFFKQPSGANIGGNILAIGEIRSSYFQDSANTKGFLATADVSNIAFLLVNRIAANIPLAIKGAASQSGDLQQWQNSATTPLARIDKLGKPAFSEATNGAQGVVTLVAGTVTVNNTNVTANSRIFLSIQSLGTVTVPTEIAVTARTAATSFTITSANVVDTSVIAYLILEPA